MADDMLPPITAKLEADTTGFHKGMEGAKKDMQSVEKEGGGSFGKLAAGIGAGMAGAVVAVSAFGVKSVGKFEEVAGQVSKLSRLTGGTSEDMSRLRFEAEESGVSFDKLSGGIVKLSKGVDANKAAFAEHNIQTHDASGKLLSMNDIIENTAEVFKNMPNGIEKNALAVKLFGKSGTDMIPMLNKGKDGLKELGGEADKFGLVIGDKNVADFKKNLVAHRQMHAAMEGLQVFIGSKLMPIVAQITTFFAENMPKALAFVRKAVNELQPVFDTVGIVIQHVFQILSDMITWLMDNKEVLLGFAVVVGGLLVAAFVSWAVAAATAAIATLTAIAPVLAVVAAIALLVGGLTYAYDHFELFRTIVNAVRDFIVDDLVPAFKVIVSFIADKLVPIFITIVEIAIKPTVIQFQILKAFIFDVLIPAFQAIWDFITNKVVPIFVKIGSTIGDVATTVAGYVSDIVGFITGIPGRIAGIASGMFDSIKDAISGAKDWVVTTVDGMVTMVAGLPGRMIHALDSIGSDLADLFGKIPGAVWGAFKSAWNAVADFASFKIPQVTIPMPPGVPDIHFGGGTITLLPHLAKGGDVTKGGLVVMNEDGGEVVDLPTGARVYPHGQEPSPAGAGIHQENHFHGITDVKALARQTAEEMAWTQRTRMAA